MLLPWFETPLFADLEAFRRDVDALLSGPATYAHPGSRPVGRGLHWRNDDDHYVLSADVPGLSNGDVSVELTGRQLSLHAKRTLVAKEGFELRHHERGEWTFKRTVQIPQDVDAQTIRASVENGVLNITLPKAAQVQPRRITVGVGGES